MAPTPVLLPGKSHGRRRLVGCSPRDQYESDTTERLPFHVSLSCIGRGNGNPLQYSCVENLRDGGTWWAAFYGVAQSRIQLNWLSSSSSSSLANINRRHFDTLFPPWEWQCQLWTPRRRQWHPTPVLLPGKSHGRRSLVGCNPWGREESDTTERLHFHLSLSRTGEGNGNPLQCSCLRILGTGEPGGLSSMGSRRVEHDWSDLAAAATQL